MRITRRHLRRIINEVTLLRERYDIEKAVTVKFSGLDISQILKVISAAPDGSELGAIHGTQFDFKSRAFVKVAGEWQDRNSYSSDRIAGMISDEKLGEFSKLMRAAKPDADADADTDADADADKALLRFPPEWCPQCSGASDEIYKWDGTGWIDQNMYDNETVTNWFGSKAPQTDKGLIAPGLPMSLFSGSSIIQTAKFRCPGAHFKVSEGAMSPMEFKAKSIEGAEDHDWRKEIDGKYQKVPFVVEPSVASAGSVSPALCEDVHLGKNQMIVTKRQLRRIIREEFSRTLFEQDALRSDH